MSKKVPNHKLAKIKFKGKTYKLEVPHTVVSEDPPISEGPFYILEGEEDGDFGYMPDAHFLAGLSKEPLTMCRVQIL